MAHAQFGYLAVGHQFADGGSGRIVVGDGGELVGDTFGHTTDALCGDGQNSLNLIEPDRTLRGIAIFGIDIFIPLGSFT